MQKYKGLSWLIGLTVIAGLSACAPDGDLESVMVFANVAVSKKSQCIAPTSSGATTETRGIGTMDLLVANHYWVFPMLYNGLTTTEGTVGKSAQEMSLNAHMISVRGAWITYDIAGLQGHWETGAETELPKQWVPTSGSVLPLTFGTIKLEAVPPPIARALDNDKAFDTLGSAGYLTVGITIEASLGDGSVIHTEPFYYPITVCRGCLVSYDVRPDECCDFLDAADFFPCFPGQDERYSCLTACWLVLYDRVDRYAQKMAVIEGHVSTLAANLDGITLPQDFLDRIAPLPDGAPPEEEPEAGGGG